jgi:hypothetical protein
MASDAEHTRAAELERPDPSGTVPCTSTSSDGSGEGARLEDADDEAAPAAPAAAPAAARSRRKSCTPLYAAKK